MYFLQVFMHDRFVATAIPWCANRGRRRSSIQLFGPSNNRMNQTRARVCCISTSLPNEGIIPTM